MFPMQLQKPTRNSKSNDHIWFLKNGLMEQWPAFQTDQLGWSYTKTHDWWKEEVILLKEMKRIVSLTEEGNISSALRCIDSLVCGVHKMTPELKEKHPEAREASADSLLQGEPIHQFEDVIYENIDAEAIYKAASKDRNTGRRLQLIEADVTFEAVLEETGNSLPSCRSIRQKSQPCGYSTTKSSSICCGASHSAGQKAWGSTDRRSHAKNNQNCYCISSLTRAFQVCRRVLASRLELKHPSTHCVRCTRLKPPKECCSLKNNAFNTLNREAVFQNV